MHVIVIVLGDLGRSPRMQYHCLSLLEAGHNVTAIGYKGERLVPALQDELHNTASRFQEIRFSVPHCFKGVPLLYFVWRVLSLTLYLSYILLFSISKHPVDFVLVQNPPAIPLLGVAYLFCRYQAVRQKGRRPGLIIDWHNLGYSMLRKGSTIQRIAKVYESCMAPLADGHFTVTMAMKEFLFSNMNVCKNIGVVYDCPPSIFEPLPVPDQHAILSKLNPELRAACPRTWSEVSSGSERTGASDLEKTLFTEQYMNADGKVAVRHRPGRPALVTSSTSWTEDEDFGVLLAALEVLEGQLHQAATNQPPRRVLVVVTGKGPQRAMYEERISRLQLEHVGIATVWLEAGDYPKLLACADVGISLHTSTSGLDLPMKVLDLFGCEVPVLAHDFRCLNELVLDRVNGRIFSTSDELANLLYELLLPLQSQQYSMKNHSYGALKTYSEQLRGRERWHSNWIDHALPVILRSTPMN
jgi:beta-1,4-mannosyltransferase